MRKRSEIKRQPAAETKVLCGVDVYNDGSTCDIEMELRDVEGQKEKQWFCTVHGFSNKMIVQPDKKAIEETSQQLKDVLEERRESIKPQGGDPTRWGSANAAKEKPIDPRFGRIIDSLFVDDVEGTYKKLEEALRVGEDRSDRAVLMRALDNAESNARLAHRLWMTAKLEQQRYEISNKIVFAAAREAANRVLQKEKDSKSRSKQIAEEDIESYIALLYPDEYEATKLRRTKAELMVKSMENLSEMWNKRCSALETMLGKAR